MGRESKQSEIHGISNGRERENKVRNMGKVIGERGWGKWRVYVKDIWLLLKNIMSE